MQFTKAAFSGLDMPFLMGQKLSNYHLLFITSVVIRFLVLAFLFKSFKEENSRRASKIIASARNNIMGRLKIRG